MSIRIYVPRDSAARSVGADDVAEAMTREASTREVDLEIIRNGSRGLFWLEPLIEVETKRGRVAYGPVTEEDVASLFDAGFTEGGEHPLSLGQTEAIPYLARQQRLTFAHLGIGHPLDLEGYEARGGMAGLKAALALTPQDICAAVTASGLRGRGGAGFPAGIKWQTVLDQPAGRKWIACNADEGDSGTFADRLLMEGDPFALLEGMAIAGLATGAADGVIYIRSEYPAAIAVMEAAGWLGDDVGGSGTAFRIVIRRGAGAYICGEESAMLNSLEGKRGTARAKPPIPAIAGLHGLSTVVNNVLTLATVPAILAKGADWYKGFGQGRSVGTQPFQLAGNIKRGGLVEVPFGVTLRALVEDFGGGTASGRPRAGAFLHGVLQGGVLRQVHPLPGWRGARARDDGEDHARRGCFC